MSIKKTYIYVYPPGRANSQIIAQHDGDHTAGRYFYLHDRLDSVRQIINTSAGVVKYYTYEPFGETIEHGGTFDNPFHFTGQFFDSEIDEYYLRARQYNPHIARFTTRDPVFGRFHEPLTLHVYLYCLNDPINRTDPSGELFFVDVTFTKLIMKSLRGAAMGAARSGLTQAMSPGAWSWRTFGGDVAGGIVTGFGGAFFSKAGIMAKVISRSAFAEAGVFTKYAIDPGNVEGFIADAFSALLVGGTFGGIKDPMVKHMLMTHGTGRHIEKFMAELTVDLLQFVIDQARAWAIEHEYGEKEQGP